jgi:hypothetical protein
MMEARLITATLFQPWDSIREVGAGLSMWSNAEQYHSMNSRMAWWYERFELADVTLFKTPDFDCSR